ncbi:MAG: hypothetical protein EOM40_04125 [Clostridia bacterium]|nr:hypothetical protein [Clostridia bacterium]NCC44193.1 hypothetical protein [Clostridia bacterium]
MKMSLLEKILMGLVISGIMLYVPQTTYAYTIETLVENENDCNEIQNKESELFDYARQFANEENPNMEIEYQRAVKIYVDTNIFTQESVSSEVVNDFLADATYLWEVPVKLPDGSCVICTVSRKPPIPEDVKAELLANNAYTKEELVQSEAKVGQWEIPTAEYSEEHKDYVTVINEILGEEYNPDDQKKVYLLGGTPNMRMPFALFEEDGNYKIMTIEVAGADNESVSMFSEQRTLGIQEHQVYDFEMVQKIIADQPEVSDSEDSGNGDLEKNMTKEMEQNIISKTGNIVDIMICFVIISIGILIVIWYKKKKLNK